MRTPEGVATISMIVRGGEDSVSAEAWGPGQQWALASLPELIGVDDDPKPLTTMLAATPTPVNRLLTQLQRRLRGLRIGRTGLVTEALIPSIMEQRVTGMEAHQSYAQFVWALGERAPGPESAVGRLMVPPDPLAVKDVPYWTFHKFGVDRRRADTIRSVCDRSTRLDALASCSSDVASAGITSISGMGAWTAAEVCMLALGDPDSVSLGDFHLPHLVSWVFHGIRRSDDAQMLESLAPYSGQRGRVLRLIVAGGMAPPRRAPRSPIQSFRNM